MPHYPITAVSRHSHYVNRTSTPDGCWQWSGGLDRYGYGRFRFDGQNVSAHRFALEEALGRALAPGMWALHACDVPTCCRNDDEGWYEVNGVLRMRRGHLFEGTRADNMADMVMKGRAHPGDLNGMRLHPERVARGERHVCAKLSDDKVRSIRSRYIRGRVTQSSLADEYGVALMTINQVILGKTWKHVV